MAVAPATSAARTKRAYFPLITAFLLGAATALAYSPFGFFWLSLLTLAALIRFWRGRTTKQAALIGFAFGLGLFGFGASWVYVSLHDYGGMPAAIAALATFLFCAVLALFPGVVGFLQARVTLSSFAKSVVLIPALWTISEWVRGWIFTGFPWLAIGYTQTPPSPLAGYAPIFGVYGVSLAVMLSAGLLASLWKDEGASRKGRGSFIFHPSLFILAAIWLAGYGLRQIEWTHRTGEPISVSLLQGNIAQEMKWEPEQIKASLETYRELALQSKSRLIVLPETALPLFYHQLPDSYTDELAAHAQANNGALLFGVPEYVAGRDEFYNSVFTGDGKQAYRKVHLVPFGEFIPWGFDWVLEILHIPLSDFSRGSPDHKPLDVAGQKVAVNICYEDAFGEEIIRQLPEATLLVNVSNVAWFGDSIAPWQHMQMSQMRALETGRFMLRATNSGLTAIINQRGEVESYSTPFTRHVLAGEVQGFTGATPYIRFGNSLTLAIVFVLVALALFRLARRPATAETK
ncbi:MAG TPA: apolipoprotein N-acyltransferase [Burkholderiales bacterium]|nr:apolipoprotein N-acyltransferase [Burkholderiales bacterium]